MATGITDVLSGLCLFSQQLRQQRAGSVCAPSEVIRVHGLTGLTRYTMSLRHEAQQRCDFCITR
jgi:hypothetical protein